MITVRSVYIRLSLTGLMVAFAALLAPGPVTAKQRLDVRIKPATGRWVKSSSPRVAFRLEGSAAEKFTCQTDLDEAVECSSPFRAKGLRDGSHRMQVRAYSADGELIAISGRSIRVDTRPPRTRVLKSPRRLVKTIEKRGKVVMRLGKGTDVRRLQCKIDRRRWRRCGRRVAIWSLPGRHRIQVRAIDRAGNRDRSPAVRRWRVSRWEPDIQAARRYAAKRPGKISFAVDLGWRTQGLKMDRRARTASTIKVLLMATYLRRSGVRNRRLDGGEKHRLGAMIRHSDNGSASSVRNIVGARAVKRVAEAGGMKRFRYSPIWGICEVTARDFAVFMRTLRHLIPERHRTYAFQLLGSITPSQRWGVGRVKHPGWKLYFKGGWGISDVHYGGIVSHQAAVLRRGKWRIGLAVLTQGNSSTETGNASLKGIASRLLRGLPR